jgi:hypothetical protein
MSDKNLKAQIKAALQLEQLREDEKTFGKVPATEFPSEENTEQGPAVAMAAPDVHKIIGKSPYFSGAVDSKKSKLSANPVVNEAAQEVYAELRPSLVPTPQPELKNKLKQEYRSVPTPTPIPGQ